MNEKETMKSALAVLNNAPAITLSTVNEAGFPESRAMLNLKKNNFKTVWFTTNTSSLKIKQIKNNPKASVYAFIPKEWKGLLLTGTIKIVNDPKVKANIWKPSWEM